MGSSSRDIKFIKNEDLTFVKLFLHYIKDDELISVFHLFLSLLITIVFAFIVKNQHNYSIINSINEKIVSASTDILGVLIAAFGLFAAITDKEFSEKIFRLGELRHVLFPFWLCSALWVINLVGGYIISLILNPPSSCPTQNSLIYLVILYYIITLFLVTIGYTLALIGDILKRTVQKAQLDYIEKNLPDISNSFNEKEIEIPKQIYTEFYFHLTLTIFVVAYVLNWYYHLSKYRYLDILFYGLVMFYLFYTYKLHKKLKVQEYLELFYKLRFTLKIFMLFISFWTVIFT